MAQTDQICRYQGEMISRREAWILTRVLTSALGLLSLSAYIIQSAPVALRCGAVLAPWPVELGKACRGGPEGWLFTVMSPSIVSQCKTDSIR